VGQAYGIVGRTDEARAVLRRLEALSSERYVSPYHMAYVHTGLGDKERTMDLTNSSSVACPDGQSDIKCGSRLIA
jgi:hypothetical protein